MSNLTLIPKIVRTGQGQCFHLPGEIRHQLLTYLETGGMLSVSTSQFSGGAHIKPRAHAGEDQFFFIETGTFTFQVAAKTAALQAGDFVFCPARTAFSFECTAQGGGKLIRGATGADGEAFTAAVAARLERGEAIPDEQLGSSCGIHFEALEMLDAPTEPPLMVRAAQADCLEAFGNAIWPLLPSAYTRHRLFVGASHAPSLNGPPLHIHDREDEFFIVRSGLIEFQVGDARVQVGPGDTVFAPRHVPHTFRVVSSEPATALVFATPGGFDDFFGGAQQLFQSGAVSPESMMALAGQHGLRFLPSA